MDSTITIIGNLTRDPEVRYTSNSTPVASFSVAVNDGYTDKDGNKVERTSFVDVSAWAGLAENVGESLSKGVRVIVTGKIEQQTWEDKDSGAKRSKLQVKATSVGPDLRWARATVTKNEKNGSGAPVAAGGVPVYDDEDPM